MIVCHCRVVSDTTVQNALADGHRSVAAVCRATGAGQDCAGCIFTLKAMVCQHRVAEEQSVVEVEGAAS